MEQDLLEQFFTSMMRFKKMEAAFSAECDIQMNELAILRGIAGECDCAQCPGINLNMPDIQEKLQITKPAVSYILNALEKKNYITREIDPKDRRKISIQITQGGKAAAKQGAQRCDEMWGALLEYFGEEDMRLLVRLLARLADFGDRLKTENECKATQNPR
ncbi:MAG: MarR family winged helix-turn-helix transcriptional regulator [Christensenellaceae bacterium]